MPGYMSVVELADHEVSRVRREVTVCPIPHKMSVTELCEEMFRNLPRGYPHRDPYHTFTSVSRWETHIVTYADIEEPGEYSEKRTQRLCVCVLPFSFVNNILKLLGISSTKKREPASPGLLRLEYVPIRLR